MHVSTFAFGLLAAAGSAAAASESGCVIVTTTIAPPSSAEVAPVAATMTSISVPAAHPAYNASSGAAAVGGSSMPAYGTLSHHHHHHHSSSGAAGTAPVAPQTSGAAVVTTSSIAAYSPPAAASSSAAAPVKAPAPSSAANKPPVYSTHAVPSAVPVPVSSKAPVPVSSAAPVPVSSAAPVPVSSAAPVPVSSKAPVPVSSAAPVSVAPVPTTLSASAAPPASSIAAPVNTGSFPKIPNTLGTHDPSRVIQDGSCFYFYSTSNGIAGWYTCNGGTTWKNTPSVLKNGIPTDVHQYVPLNDGHNVWAPDVIYNPTTKLFYIYYAVAAWKQVGSAIGLVTSPTLDPATAVWKEAGVVIYQTHSTDPFSAIDPCPFFDAAGDMYLSFGSGYGGTHATALNVIPLDKTTGLRSGTTLTVIQGCSCEASYIHYHGGSYWLFYNTGGCCNGATSTYTIHVAKASSPTGPFGASSVFLASFGSEHGPGQIGITTIGDGTDYFTYHYYPNSGGSVLGYGTIDWSGGAPVAKTL